MIRSVTQIRMRSARCVAAHAFGPGLPYRELDLSPDHSVFAEGVLIPIRELVNGTTVRRVKTRDVTYFLVELAEHDALFANGLPAESYLDTGNRSSFANGGPVVAIHPESARDRAWFMFEA